MADHCLSLCVADKSLTPAREELTILNAELMAAVATQEATAEPLRRLEWVVAETDRLTQRLDEMRCDHDGRIGEWIAVGDPEAERPSLAPEAIGVEQRLQALARDLPGARAAQPAAQAALSAAVAKVTALSASRADALARAALEAAEVYAERVWLPSLIEALRHQAVLDSLRAELSASPNMPGAPGAAGRIIELSTQTRQRAAIPRNISAGRRLLDQLATDPAAELEA